MYIPQNEVSWIMGLTALYTFIFASCCIRLPTAVASTSQPTELV